MTVAPPASRYLALARTGLLLADARQTQSRAAGPLSACRRQPRNRLRTMPFAPQIARPVLIIWAMRQEEGFLCRDAMVGEQTCAPHISEPPLPVLSTVLAAGRASLVCASSSLAGRFTRRLGQLYPWTIVVPALIVTRLVHRSQGLDPRADAPAEGMLHVARARTCHGT